MPCRGQLSYFPSGAKKIVFFLVQKFNHYSMIIKFLIFIGNKWYWWQTPLANKKTLFVYSRCLYESIMEKNNNFMKLIIRRRKNRIHFWPDDWASIAICFYDALPLNHSLIHTTNVTPFRLSYLELRHSTLWKDKRMPALSFVCKCDLISCHALRSRNILWAIKWRWTHSIRFDSVRFNFLGPMENYDVNTNWCDTIVSIHLVS